VSHNLGQLIGLPRAISLLPMVIGLGAVLTILARRASSTGRRLISWSGIAAFIVAAAWFIGIINYESGHPRILALFQGKALWEVDQLPAAAPYLETSIANLETDPNIPIPTKVELFQMAVPVLRATYEELGDQASLQQLRARIERLQEQPAR